MNKTYSEMIRHSSFEDRFEYLKLGGSVGASTFGFDRYINQEFYSSWEWKNIRRHVIIRDKGCDLAVLGHEIHTDILVHHLNPMTPNDVIHQEAWIIDPEFLICTTKNTHNAIHYGDRSLLRVPYVPRSPGDTKLW